MLEARLAWQWFANDFALSSQPDSVNHLAIFGLLLMISAFMTFTFTLVLHALAARLKIRIQPQ